MRLGTRASLERTKNCSMQDEPLGEPGRRETRAVRHDVGIELRAMSRGDAREGLASDVPHSEHERQS